MDVLVKLALFKLEPCIAMVEISYLSCWWTNVVPELVEDAIIGEMGFWW